jgi:hypothetical protein
LAPTPYHLETLELPVVVAVVVTTGVEDEHSEEIRIRIHY